eukprot:scaffold5605_cov128-Cylindrotheca_fusiformis.AAC.8
MKVLLLFAWSLMTVAVLGQCSLCPGGASFISNPYAQIHFLSDSCGVVEAVVAESSTNCNDVVASANSEIDYTRFCCSDSNTTTGGCEFCEGDVYDPNIVLGVDINPQGLTCQESKEIIDYFIADTLTCASLVAVNDGCCRPSCSVCPYGSTMSDGNRRLPGQSITCGSLDDELGNLNTDSECKAQLTPFVGYDLASYCGCTGSLAPSICEFCEEGFDNGTAVVSNIAGAIQCSAFEGLADFIKSPENCSTWQEDCCSALPSTVPSALPSSVPSALPSSLPSALPSSGPTYFSSANGQSMSSTVALVTVVVFLLKVEEECNII